jgi:thiamine biosynthesis lipoprotein
MKLAAGMIEPDRPLPDEARVRLLFARVLRQIDRMERMVYDFLDAARIESGQLELQLERCDARALARAVVEAGRRSGGLVDATLVDEIEAAGYCESLRDREGAPLAELLSAGGEPAAAAATGRAGTGPSPRRAWELIEVDERRGTITRPPGVRIDSGGIAKGLAADLVAVGLGSHPAFAVDCCGDLRIGGRNGVRRAVHVSDPFGGEPVHTFALTRGAVATSGIGARAWTTDAGSAHHLLDPATGRPAFTGVVQATALAPTGFLAEVYAKAALLAGPERAAEWLPHGGVVVADGGRVEVLGPRAEATLAGGGS